jgi:lipoyl(octanoyl) transferase
MNALDLIKLIQDSVIDLLKTYNIKTYPLYNEKTGVWHGDKKIASIGIAINKFSTYHGMALNVSTDLKKFNFINPCNFSPDIMTSMEKIKNQKYDLNEIKNRFIEITLKKFDINDYVIKNDII